jgi:hypothetical protein
MSAPAALPLYVLHASPINSYSLFTTISLIEQKEKSVAGQLPYHATEQTDIILRNPMRRLLSLLLTLLLLSACRSQPEYHTTIAMTDLRPALSHEQINLIGVSYGSRAALENRRLFPEQTISGLPTITNENSGSAGVSPAGADGTSTLQSSQEE